MSLADGPEPAARAAAFAAGMAWAGADALVTRPTMAPRDAAFDAWFGARLAALPGGQA